MSNVVKEVVKKRKSDSLENKINELCNCKAANKYTYGHNYNIVCCDSKDKAINLLRNLDKHGFRWRTNDSLLSFNRYTGERCFYYYYTDNTVTSCCDTIANKYDVYDNYDDLYMEEF